MSEAVTIQLPMPISVNALYVRARGRRPFLNPKYRAWKEEAGWMLQSQRPKPIKGHYHLTIAVPPSRGDVDNRAKAVGDLLQAHGVVENDRLATHVLTTIDPSVPKGQCRVILRAAPPELGHAHVAYVEAGL
jgi:Holliday junction resolvase RusA-like endonuclease